MRISAEADTDAELRYTSRGYQLFLIAISLKIQFINTKVMLNYRMLQYLHHPGQSLNPSLIQGVCF